jgi:hypothetical protein
MSETPANGESGRLVACRSCGNRVPRSVRRCPACGASEPPSAAVESAPAARPAAPRPSGRRGPMAVAMLAAALAGSAVTAAFFVLRPAAPPSPPIELRSVPTPPASEQPREAVAPSAAPEPSRSRGRGDWLFFFKTGDRLARMSDDAPAGMVLRTEKRHAFGDGTTGPAYLLQLPDGGGQRFVDADELERSARLQ